MPQSHNNISALMLALLGILIRALYLTLFWWGFWNFHVSLFYFITRLSPIIYWIYLNKNITISKQIVNANCKILSRFWRFSNSPSFSPLVACQLCVALSLFASCLARELGSISSFKLYFSLTLSSSSLTKEICKFFLTYQYARDIVLRIFDCALWTSSIIEILIYPYSWIP